MSTQLRHTVALLIGEELQPLAPRLRQYTLMYGHGEAPRHLQVLSCQPTGTDAGQPVAADCPLSLCCHTQATPQAETTFTSGLERRYQLQVSHQAEVSTPDQLKQYLASLFSRTVTIEDPGFDGSLNVCLCLPLHDARLWTTVQTLVQAFTAIGQQVRIDLLGVPVPGQPADPQLVHSIVGDDCIHRLILFEDTNAQGLALNLDTDAIVRILGEFSLLYVEHYDQIFPVNQMGQRIDATAFGLSMLAFDRVYFVHYLLRRAYLHVLQRERVGEGQTVNVNRAAQLAQTILERHVGLYSRFVHDELEPALARHHSSDDVGLAELQRLEALLQQRLDAATADMQQFITDPTLSLPEKQAVMAQLLGEDDPLVVGVQYHKEQLILDDCDRECLSLFIDEHNRQADPAEHLHLQLDEMKALRARMRQRTAFIRKKEEELSGLKHQTSDAEQIARRITEAGFQFGTETFKLLPDQQTPQLFEQTYQPHPVSQRSIDLREHFTPVKNQGTLGACSAFALVSIFEYVMRKSDPGNPDLSERFAYYNARRRAVGEGQPLTDDGSSFYDVVTSLANDGLASELLCPYTPALVAPSAEAYADARHRLVRVAKNVEVTHQSLTSALADGYPVAISLRVFDSFVPDRHGFIYRPSPQEVRSRQGGNHAMVLCGYSEEERVYIVRNSWGTTFGDKGYCYIPFSYIDDPKLNQQACIVTDIAVATEVKVGGYGQLRTLQFNLTDDTIRQAILRILIEEERLALEHDAQEYGRLRYSYEQLLQTLSNPTRRDEILDNSLTLLHSQIATAEQQYREFVAELRPQRLEAFRQETLHFLVRAIPLWLISVATLITFLCFPQLALGQLIAGIVTGVATLLSVFYLWHRRYQRSMLRRELEAEAASLQQTISSLRRERAEKHLRLHLAGKMVSSVTDVKLALIGRYHGLISYIHGLESWLKEEQSKLGEMVVPNRTPCIPLLDNRQLDAYFEQRKDDITRHIHLYDLVGQHSMEEADILRFKLQLRDRLIAALERECAAFSMLEYVTGKTCYPYLGSASADVASLMPCMDRRSECFLRIRQTGQQSDLTLEKTVFVHTDLQSDRNVWRDTYRRYFSQYPGDGNLDSPYKLIELQLQNLRSEQMACLQQ